MGKFEVCKTADVEEGEVRQVIVDDRAPIAIYKLDGEFYATDDTCTHGQASLSDGYVEYGSIVCPFHMGSFEIKTGKPSSPPCVMPLNIYAVRVEDDTVCIELPE